MASPLPLHGKPLLYAVSTFASLGVFLFGYDQGVMSGIITGPYFKSAYADPQTGAPPTAAQVGTVVSVLEIGAFVTSLAAGRLADIKGRRWVIGVGSLIFTVGGLLQTIAPSLVLLGLGRVVSGCGVGFLSMIVPVYQSEVSGKDERGLLGAVEFTGNIIGYASSVWIDYFCSFIPSNMSFRIPLLIQSVIGLLLFLGSFLLPESPRHLFATDRPLAGRAVLCQLRGLREGHERLEDEVGEIEAVVAEEQKEADASYRALWRRYKGRVLIACSAQAGAQLNGINVISYYAPLVFEQAGWVGRQAIMMTGVNAIVYVLSSLPPWYLIDRAGRRPILLWGAVIMAIALFATGFFMALDVSFTPTAVVVCVISFNAAFGSSWGPVPWLYPAEIMPLAFRAKGVSLSTATNWFFNFVIGEMTPILQELIGWRLYVMHAFFCLCSFTVVWFLFPETAGCSLEEMSTIFNDDVDEDDGSDSDAEQEDAADDDDFDEQFSGTATPTGTHTPTTGLAAHTTSAALPPGGLAGWWGKRKANGKTVKYSALDGAAEP